MPNHIQNVITLHDTPLRKVGHLLFNSEAEIDFNQLLPLPLNCWRGSVGREHEEAFPFTGLAEARRTWGTKWNAYGNPEAKDVLGSTIITLQTAWSHPRGWVVALFNSLNCRITAEWLDEGSDHAWREIYLPEGGLLGGPSWAKEKLEEGSADHKRLHLLLWGCEQFEEEADA
jgi:hypothetical protein